MVKHVGGFVFVAFIAIAATPRDWNPLRRWATGMLVALTLLNFVTLTMAVDQL